MQDWAMTMKSYALLTNQYQSKVSLQNMNIFSTDQEKYHFLINMCICVDTYARFLQVQSHLMEAYLWLIIMGSGPALDIL